MHWLFHHNFDIANPSLLEDTGQYSVPHTPIMDLYVKFQFAPAAEIPTNLYFLVRYVRRIKSKEPKYKIFALAGIASDRKQVAINYEKLDREVF